MAATETAKAWLRQTNENGVSVYSHLTEVLATLLTHKPDAALDALEGVSLQCKQAHYAPDATAVPEAPAEAPPPPTEREAAAAAWHEANATLLAPKKGEDDAPADQGSVRDTLAERALFEWCAPRRRARTRAAVEPRRARRRRRRRSRTRRTARARRPQQLRPPSTRPPAR
jgi:hypothetical protein